MTYAQLAGQVIRNRPRPVIHAIEIDEVTIEDRMETIDGQMGGQGRCLFEHLFPDRIHSQRAWSWLPSWPSLELVKLDKIVFQAAEKLWAYLDLPQTR